jgi:glutamate synthase (NADPH/NADH) small chain
VAGDALDYLPDVTAEGKRVVVLGGGDTASDCIGTAHREGAASITNVHYRPAPPAARPPEQPWPLVPDTLTVSSSHEEGVERVWAADTVGFEGDDAGRVTGVRTVDVRWTTGADGRRRKERVPGTARVHPADLVLLAIGYLGPEAHPLLDGLGVEGDARGRLTAPDETDAPAHRLPYATGVAGVFAAGDSRRGASLVVHAIAEGRECARSVDRHLTGTTTLPTRGGRGLQG